MKRLIAVLILGACLAVVDAPGIAAQQCIPTTSEDCPPGRGDTTTTTSSSTTTTGETTTTTEDVGVLPTVTEQPGPTTTECPEGPMTGGLGKQTVTCPEGSGGTGVRGGTTGRGALSRTGSDTFGSVVFGSLLIAAGVGVSVAARRRRRSLVV